MRSEMIGVRVTPRERRALERQANREDLAVSTWARRLMLRELRATEHPEPDLAA